MTTVKHYIVSTYRIKKALEYIFFMIYVMSWTRFYSFLKKCESRCVWLF
uniref:Uncharacterized protein n=3 Tax=Anguilla anguilla TaxID=7936 RepID=A0A0E9VME2_ANGAN